MVIGAVALIVIGPEKLPRVARTVGTLLGKAQRYVADVKAEVNRSIELEELKKMKDTVETAARDVESSHQVRRQRPREAAVRSRRDANAQMRLSELTAYPPVYPEYRHPTQEMAHQARRHAQLVQGAQRHPHQGAFRRGARGPLPPAKIQLMADPNREDELAGTEQPFVAHLVELRDRLIKAMIAIGVVAACCSCIPGPAALYDILAAPLGRPPAQGRDADRHVA